ncbi:Arginine N-methyltransferase 2 [Gonapodya sp. JEL0774]|nr:Arginine N-methyltransferase 2 [Gonapodya sp. JEL0774]
MTTSEDDSALIISFLSAVSSGDLAQITKYLNDQPSLINECSPEPPHQSALHLAAATGNIPLVELLIDSGCPWNSTDDNYLTAGEIAKKFGHDELYDKLVQEGARCELLLRAIMDLDVDENEEQDEVVEGGDDQAQQLAKNPEQDLEEVAATTTATTTAFPLPAIDMAVHSKSVYVNGRRIMLTSGMSSTETTVPPTDDNEVTIAHLDAPQGVHVEASTGTSLDEYLANPVSYSHDEHGNERLLDVEGNPIEMEWERPIMDATAEAILPLPAPGEMPKLTAVNIGFGMGMVDTAIQRRLPLQHYICEAHPTVLSRMVSTGWIDQASLSLPSTTSTTRPSAHCLQGKWQETLSKEGLAKAGIPENSFDAVFFDTFSEVYETSLLPLHRDYLPHLLRRPNPTDPSDRGGVYSFFNGLASGNTFFHDVACRVAEVDLADAGFDTEWVQVPFDGPDEVTGEVKGGREAIGDGEALKGVWEGTRYAYWRLGGIYRMPMVRWATESK